MNLQEFLIFHRKFVLRDILIVRRSYELMFTRLISLFTFLFESLFMGSQTKYFSQSHIFDTVSILVPLNLYINL